MPDPGPAFAKAPSYISDVQLRHTLSPDNKACAILFDNFTLRLSPGGLPIATRTLSIAFPFAGITDDTRLTINVRGNVTLQDGACASLAFRVLGVTHVLDPLGSGKSNDGDFVKELNLVVRPGDVLSMTILLALERDAAHPSAEGLLTIDSIDMALT